MKRNKKMTLMLIALAALTFGSSSAWARHALLTADKPDSTKVESIAQEMEVLGQQLAQQRVKFDLALAQAGISRGVGMGPGSCGGGRGHMEMSHW